MTSPRVRRGKRKLDVTTELTCVTKRTSSVLSESFMTGMPKTTMPQARQGDNGEGMCGGRTKRIELAGAIAPGDDGPSAEVLQGKTKRVNSIEQELSVVN